MAHSQFDSVMGLFQVKKKKTNQKKKRKTNKNDVNAQKWHFAQAIGIAALGFAALTNHVVALDFQKKDMKFLLMEWSEPVKF